MPVLDRGTADDFRTSGDASEARTRCNGGTDRRCAAMQATLTLPAKSIDVRQIMLGERRRTKRIRALSRSTATFADPGGR